MHLRSSLGLFHGLKVKKMPRAKTKNDTQIAIKLSAETIKRADTLAALFAAAGCEANRSTVLRAAITKGIEVLEAEWGVKGRKKGAGK